MFSQTVEYALRAAVHLATIAPNARTTEQIAAATKVPRAYLSKVLQSLVRAKLVHSQRGVLGGMSLARRPDQISILDVVNAVEPICRIRVCPLGIAQHGSRLCTLHRKMDAALAQVETAFRESTLSDILGEPAPYLPLCDVESNGRPHLHDIGPKIKV